MFDAAVEVGIATYLARPEVDDDEVRAILERAGVAPWLAQRLVLFLPLALGRRLLAGATLTKTFRDGEVERPLSDEPVYAAAEARSHRAGKQELEVIGLRSSEVHAVNTALNHGSRLEDLVLSPPTFVSPLLDAGRGHGGVPSPRQAFADFLSAHGHALKEREGALCCGPLQIDARVFPRPRENVVSAQVDFAVKHPALAVPWLLESFGGMAATWQGAIGQNIEKFERGSLHVLIEALLARGSCPDQVSWERVEHPGGAFEACLGGQLVLYCGAPAADLGPLLEGIKAALAGRPLSHAVHALRLYVCFDGEKMLSHEALLDNEPWEEGAALVAGHGWPRVERLWGSRLFLLLVPEVA